MKQAGYHRKSYGTITALVAISGGTCMIGGISHSAPAAKEAKEQLIATVDMQRVFSDNWKTFKTADATVQAQQLKYKAIIQELLPDNTTDAGVPPVEANTVASWLHLKEQEQLHPAAMSAAERQSLKDYEAQGKKAVERLQALENKYPNVTADEQTELDKLHDLRQKAAQAINGQAHQYSEQLQDQFRELQTRLEGQVQAALKQVCAQQHITYVFNAAFVSGSGDIQKSLLFSTDQNTDITPLVLNALNK
ncbi:MAG: OmpH family outer membrane protein [Abitibacteriaceae bacterium]|nr:OmpH family outer membrane protein [Abditibacteriaceae bacterium]MBV9867092.1 OmpH family outer membrane protein [Abditibacteriaceae bacterium]